MDILLVLLKNGVTLISESENLEYEPKVHLINPHTISGKSRVVLTPWPEHSKDDHILLNSENLLTVCEPTDEIVKAYLKKVGKTEEDLKSTSRPVILNEEVQDQIPFDDDEDYEPRYVETDLI